MKEYKIILILSFLFVTSLLSAQQDSTDKIGFSSLFKNKFDSSKPYAAQLNPRAVSFVQEYIKKQGKELERMKSWGKPYFDVYDNILKLYGIPT